MPKTLGETKHPEPNTKPTEEKTTHPRGQEKTTHLPDTLGETKHPEPNTKPTEEKTTHPRGQEKTTHLPDTLGETPPRSLGNFVATAKVKCYLTAPDDSEDDIPPLRSLSDWRNSDNDMPLLGDRRDSDSDGDTPPLHSLSDWHDSVLAAIAADRSRATHRRDSDSDDDIPPLRSLSSSPPPPQGRQRWADTLAANKASIARDSARLRTRIIELIDRSTADGGEHSAQATTQLVDRILGPRGTRSVPHPNAAACSGAWFPGMRPTLMCVARNPESWTCGPGRTMAYTYVDDTYVYDAPADGGAAREPPNTPPPLWTQDNTTACVDVSCAYGKARETSKR